MSYEISWDEKAREFLRKLHPPDAKRIIKKVNAIADEPLHYLETLVEIKSYQLMVGDYRILIDVDENKKKLSIVLIGHRRDIYQYVQRTGFSRK
ncbi:MAG: type II toxin-antitoxin system RelE/ParE family toxin [Nanoarchaeota archaeon]